MSMHYSEAHGNGMKTKKHESAEGKQREMFEAISENKKSKSKKDLFKIIAKKRRAVNVMKPGMPRSKKHKKHHGGIKSMMGMGD